MLEEISMHNTDEAYYKRGTITSNAMIVQVHLKKLDYHGKVTPPALL